MDLKQKIEKICNDNGLKGQKELAEANEEMFLLDKFYQNKKAVS